MQIAVIVPVFNGAPWLAATLRSIMAQTRPPVEVVVVDDGSTDDSAAIARGFPGVIVVASPGKGVHAARRKGLAMTSAPLVALLDADDLWHPRHLEELAALIAQTGAPAAVAGAQRFMDESRLRLSPGGGRSRPLDPWERFPLAVIPCPACGLIRRSALEAIGGWPEAFRLGGDVHTWLRLSEREPLVASEGITVGYRCQPESMSAQLRAKAATDFFGHVCEANAAALAAFHRTGRDSTVQDRRWRAYEAIRELLGAAFALDPLRVQRAAQIYEERLAGEAREFVGACHGVLFYYLVAREVDGIQPGERQRLLTVLRAWPRGRSDSRRLLFGSVNAPAWRRAVREQFRREPWQLGAWWVWGRVAQQALAGYCSRVGSRWKILLRLR